jgi:hypothetical protein
MITTRVRTHRPKRAWTTRAIAAGIATALVGFSAPLLTTPASATDSTTYATASLHFDHRGTLAADFPEKRTDCPDWPAGTDGWHFVLDGNVTHFHSITATLLLANGTTTTVTLNQGDFISHPTGKHAYVYTPAGATLIDATAQVKPAPGAAADAQLTTRFLLSHVCVYVPPAPTPTPTATATATATATPAVTVTVTATTTVGVPVPGPTVTVTETIAGGSVTLPPVVVTETVTVPGPTVTVTEYLSGGVQPSPMPTYVGGELPRTGAGAATQVLGWALLLLAIGMAGLFGTRLRRQN